MERDHENDQGISLHLRGGFDLFGSEAEILRLRMSCLLPLPKGGIVNGCLDKQVPP